MNLLVFEPLKLERPWTLSTYRSIGGYTVWEQILADKPPREEIIDKVKASGLRGRGGAGFPTGTRASGASCRAQLPGAEVPGVQLR